MTIYAFPPDFLWGTATAAYQIEGASREDGRGPSIWDTFSHTPGKVLNGDNGDVACDSYHRYEEDIRLMKELGVRVHRFSVSWPRIFPSGRGAVNRKGLDFYHRFVDRLLEQGIEPFCTLYHWDLPQALQDEGGWDNRATIDAFVGYAETMFKEFAGKIKRWVTFNEPWCSSFLAHSLGVHAPGYRDLQLAANVAHHILLAHGKTVARFREMGVAGQIGIAPNISWAVPFSKSRADRDAGLRAIMCTGDYFMDPIYFGTYPQPIVDCYAKAGVTLPIRDGDMEAIRRPIDFLGVNYYSADVIRSKPGAGIFESEKLKMGYETTDNGWPVDPVGFYDCLHYIREKYGDIEIYITENGVCVDDAPENGRVRDLRRISYFRRHLISLQRAMTDGIRVKGYMAWSLLDNFEWAEGYGRRFGLVFVDFNTLERTKKDSFDWYREVIREGQVEA